MRKTRKQNAAELKRLIDKGPDFGLELMGTPYPLNEKQRQEINEIYSKATRNWLSWLHGPVMNLVPEAKDFWP